MRRPASPSIRFATVCVVGGFVLLVCRFWHPIYEFTYFFELGSSREGRTIAAFREYPVLFHPMSYGYDGQYYAQIAHHPTLTANELRPSIDALAYRSRRILVPALAWLAGMGQPAWIIRAYSLVNVVCWLVLAVLLWRLFEVDSWRAWLAWFGIMFSAGVLVSVRLALVDLPALMLIAAALLAVRRESGWMAITCLAAAGLARESSLAACPAVWAHNDRSVRGIVRNGFRVVLTVAPLIAWSYYVALQVGRPDVGGGNFTWPMVGLIDKWRDTVIPVHEQVLPAWTTFLAMLALLAQAVQVSRRWQPTDVTWRIGALFCGLMIVLGPAVWEGYPGAAMRVLLPLNLAANLLALRNQASARWLLLCNLTVFSGMLTIAGEPARDLSEISRARRTGAATVLHLGSGWDGWDYDNEHPWGSTSTPGHLIVRTWPSTSIDVIVSFSLQNPKAAVATIATRDAVLWRGQLPEGRRVPIVLPLTVPNGKLELFLTRDTDSSGPEAGLALFEPIVRLTGP